MAKVSFSRAGGASSTTTTTTTTEELDIDALTELDEQPALDDFLAVLDTTAGELRKVSELNLGVHIKPDSHGHMPVLADGAANPYVRARIPGITREGKIVIPTAEPHSGHAGSAEWAIIESVHTSSDVGNERVPTVAAVDLVVSTGDKVQYTSGGTTSYYKANRSFTVLTGDVADGLPDQASATGWDAYTRLTAPSGFRGVVALVDRDDISSPQNNDWVYIVHAGTVTAERYRVTGGISGWYNFYPTGIDIFLGYHYSFASAFNAVHGFSDSQRTAAVIRGDLAFLDAYTAPTSGYIRNVWVPTPGDSAAPRAYFFVSGQTERNPDSFPWDIGTQGIRTFDRVAFNQNTPNLHYDGGEAVYGNIFVAAADVSSNMDSAGVGDAVADLEVFVLPRGRHDIHLVFEASHSDLTKAPDYITIAPYAVTSGNDDRQISGDYLSFSPTSAGPDGVRNASSVSITDIISDGARQMYIRMAGLGDDSGTVFRGEMMIEYKGAV